MTVGILMLHCGLGIRNTNTFYTFRCPQSLEIIRLYLLSGFLFKLVSAFWFTSKASHNYPVHSYQLPPTFRSSLTPTHFDPLLFFCMYIITYRRWSSFFPIACIGTTPCASRVFLTYHLTVTIYISCLRFVPNSSARSKPRRCCIYQNGNYKNNKNSSSELKSKEKYK